MKALCSHSTHAGGYRHNCLVVYRRRIWEWFCKSYWVVCIYCDGTHGPHRDRRVAWNVASAFNDTPDVFPQEELCNQ